MDIAEQDRYHDLGPSYFWFAGKRQLVMEILKSRLPSSWDADKKKVLDIGCGPGHDLHDLQPFGKLHGLDPSLAALEWCEREYSGAQQLVCAGGENLPFQSKTFDLIIMFDVLEHIKEDEASLKECRRILKPGGLLVITVPAFQWLWGAHDDRYGHVRRYTVPGIHHKLERNKFVVDHATYIEWIFTLPLWIMRNLKRMFASTAKRDDFVRVPGWLNRLLTYVITMETVWVKNHTMPWGVSIVALARASDE